MAVAWSNESIELWFLLYFEDYCANNGREQYIEKLNKYFEYSKAREEFLDAKISSMSQMVPATRVYELIEELDSYLHP